MELNGEEGLRRVQQTLVGSVVHTGKKRGMSANVFIWKPLEAEI
jgi:hypothetical protein